MKSLCRRALAPLALTLITTAQAVACPSDEEARSVAQAVVSGTMIAPPAAKLSPADAACGRDKLVRNLEASLGRVAGYKAGLTNPAAQKAFGMSEPMRGVLFEKMLVREGPSVSIGTAPSVLFEADLIVEVGDASINAATTPLEVLRAVKAFYPFIEVPWAPFSAPLPSYGTNLLYANVAAYRGVLGKPFTIEPTPAGVGALAAMTVTLFDAGGAQLDSGKGEALMGNPLNVVMWIAADLRKSGQSLKPGDLLSLGTFSRLHPARIGTSARVRYEGVPGNPEVTATFAQ